MLQYTYRSERTCYAKEKNFLPILALAVGHLVTDLQAGALPIVLPHLKELFTLSYSQLAAIVLTQNITSSVIQPVFGYITDKRSMPVLLPFCAAMAGAGFAAIGWVSSYTLILLTVIIIGIASATYHPQASKTVNFLSDENSKAKNMGIFFSGRQCRYGRRLHFDDFSHWTAGWHP